MSNIMHKAVSISFSNVVDHIKGLTDYNRLYLNGNGLGWKTSVKVFGNMLVITYLKVMR